MKRISGLSGDIDAVLLKALEKEPAQRYASAGAMLSALAEAAHVAKPNSFKDKAHHVPPIHPENVWFYRIWW